MDVLSAKINQALVAEKKFEFMRAQNSYSGIESIFNSVNSKYLSSEQSYMIKQFQEELAEEAYGNLQTELRRLRYKQKVVDNTSMVTTTKMIAHEKSLKEMPVIQEIEGKITSNQAQIVQYQSELNVLKASDSIIKYEAITKEVKGLRGDESNLIGLIKIMAKDGKDTSNLEQRLEIIRKEIAEKEKELEELQPEYDEMKGIEDKLNELLKENSDLIQQRLKLDPEFVKYTYVYNFFDTVVQGNGNGLGVEADISRNKANISDVEEIYSERSEQSVAFQAILNKDMSLQNSVKSDLESTKAIREYKENIFSQINK